MIGKFINAFPGYEFVNGKNMYRGVDLGKGGYVYAEPGIYTNVALLDVASMHPHSIISMNCFGEYTQHFKDMLDARVAIKHGDFDTARSMLNGRLAPYLDDESKAKDLSNALKTALNSCYGLTAANFENPMRDIRNKNNIVACKGALFMKTLQDEVQSRGFTVVHIKTDSIKIANATPEIIEFTMNFAKPYGYTFEHEATYDRMCIVNDAVYIAKYATADVCENMYGYVPGDNKKKGGTWTATGAQFAVPYVFKTLFSKEPIEFEDMCVTKEVKGSAIYLDMNEKLPDVSAYEDELKKLRKDGINPERQAELLELIEQGHDRHFVGRIGNFCPIKPKLGGGELVRDAKDASGNVKYDSVTGANGYRWLESEAVRILGNYDSIDKSYFNAQIDGVIYGNGTGKNRKPGISDFGDFERFVADEPYIKVDIPDFPPDDDLPYYIGPELEKMLEKERRDNARPPWVSPEEWEDLQDTNDAFKRR